MVSANHFIIRNTSAIGISSSCILFGYRNCLHVRTIYSASAIRMQLTRIRNSDVQNVQRPTVLSNMNHFLLFSVQPFYTSTSIVVPRRLWGLPIAHLPFSSEPQIAYFNFHLGRKVNTYGLDSAWKLGLLRQKTNK